MAQTFINASSELLPGTVTRSRLNTSASGLAVITKLLPGSGVILSSTGADAGTGDVTISVSATPISGLAISGSSTGITTLNSANASATNYTITLPAITDTLVTLTSTQTLTNKTLTSPILVSPSLGTPTALSLTNATGLPIATGLVGAGSGVLSALQAAVTGSGGIVRQTSPTISSPTFTAPVLGTPLSGILTNTTGLPVSTGLDGLGTGVATALGTTVSGSGSIVLATTPTLNSPILVTPALGTPSSVVLTHGTGLPVSTGITGLGTGVASALGLSVTGSGEVVLATSPTLVTPNLGTPSTINLANAAGLPLTALTGSTLPSGIVNSSLTSVGTLSGLSVSGTSNLSSVSFNNSTPVSWKNSSGTITFGTAGSAIDSNSGTLYFDQYDAGLFQWRGSSYAVQMSLSPTGLTVSGSIVGSSLTVTGATNVVGGFNIGGVGAIPITANLSVTATNTLSSLSISASGLFAILFVNGQGFISGITNPAFSISGTTVTWNSVNAGFSILTTDSVCIFYSH